MKCTIARLLPLLVAIMASVSCDRRHTLSSVIGADSLAVSDTLPTDTSFYLPDDDEGLSLKNYETESFNDFIFAFMRNTRFQAERISFPLPVTLADGTEEVVRSGKQFRDEFRLPGNDYYTLILGDKQQMDILQNDSLQTHISLQLIRLGHPQAECYNFERTDGQWFLKSRRYQMIDPHVNSFLMFYEHFSTDSVFQQKSLARELHFSMDDPDLGGMEGTIDPSQWPVFRPEMPAGEFVNIDIQQSFPNPHRIYFMQCGISNGMLDIFTFHNDGTRWQLVAYEN